MYKLNLEEAEEPESIANVLWIIEKADVGNLISGSSAFSISNLYIWNFLVHILLKPSLKDFEHYLA